MSVRPSVCHTPVLCRNGKHILIFSPSGSHTMLIFPHQTAWQHFEWDPLYGASNSGAIKIAILYKLSRFIAETMQYSYKKWNANRKPHPSCRMYQFEWSWVTSNPDFKGTPLFHAKYLRNCTRHRQVTIKYKYGLTPYSRMSFLIISTDPE